MVRQNTRTAAIRPSGAKRHRSIAEARALFDRLLGLANDLGLLSEEYDPAAKRSVGNFPQAFSHLALMISAMTMDGIETRLPSNPDDAPHT